MTDMVKGSYEQALIGAYAAFQSDDRFAISRTSQYQTSEVSIAAQLIQ